jgi:hypothetical protein
MEPERGFDGGRPGEREARRRGGDRETRRHGGDREARSRHGVDLALTGELVEEVLRTALALESVISNLLDDLPADAFPGRDDPAVVLMQMIVGTVHPAAAVAGVRDCRSAIALVVAIRERVLADLKIAAELAEERG